MFSRPICGQRFSNPPFPHPYSPTQLIHTLSIPLFLLVWPFFSQSDPYSNYVAATVPMANMWKIISAGQGGEDGLGKAVSRSGDEKEVRGRGEGGETRKV